MRVGTGWDVHKLVKGRELVIGGIKIPHQKGLSGHSDADVLAHAIMDALLGASCLGDIGQHFPPTDKKYKGISSMELMKKVASSVRSAGFRILNIDSTVIAESPKISPHTKKMSASVARALGVPASLINIKSKTEEGLGYIGKGKAIAAQAVCLLEGPDSCC